MRVKPQSCRLTRRITSNLHSRIPHHGNIEKVLKHLRRAQSIEKEYVEWCTNLPNEWTPKVAAWIDEMGERDLGFATCHPGRVDVYGELWMATTHNIAGAFRLFILTAILRCTA